MSDQYGQVLVSSNPRGRFEECIISGTPKPGTCMTMTTTEPVGGRFEYEGFNGDNDGDRLEIAVLLDDFNQGVVLTTAYTAGTRGLLYFPLPGDELQMLVANIAGTSDTFTLGDRLIVNDGDGLLIATTGSPEREPFRVRQTVSTALTADTHVLCMYTGG